MSLEVRIDLFSVGSTFWSFEPDVYSTSYSISIQQLFSWNVYCILNLFDSDFIKRWINRSERDLIKLKQSQRYFTSWKCLRRRTSNCSTNLNLKDALPLKPMPMKFLQLYMRKLLNNIPVSSMMIEKMKLLFSICGFI